MVSCDTDSQEAEQQPLKHVHAFTPGTYEYVT